MTTVNILGSVWEIIVGDKETYPALISCGGFCDFTSRKIVIDNLDEAKKSDSAVENLKVYQDKIIRHEVIHAYLFESGLAECSDWAQNEEMIDWLAIQIPKISALLNDLNI